MPSFIYDSALFDALTGAIDFKRDGFKAMLVTKAYVPDKIGHSRRSAIIGELVAIDYEPGGMDAKVAITLDYTSAVEIKLGGAVWRDATISAHGAVYYKSRGGAASADELVAYIDFNGEIASVNGPFNLHPTTLQIQN